MGLMTLSLSKNNSVALQRIIEILSELEKGKEVVSIIVLTLTSPSEEEEGGTFNVRSVSNKVIPEEVTNAIGDSILITLKHFNHGEGEIVDGP